MVAGRTVVETIQAELSRLILNVHEVLKEASSRRYLRDPTSQYPEVPIGLCGHAA